MKHTKGPWICGYGDGLTGPTSERAKGACCDEGRPTWPVSKEKETIAIVPKPEFDGDMKANACLIAAAPDLFEACKVTLTVFEHWNPDDDPTAVLEWFGEAAEGCRRAIAKAEGK